jgi:hypothetical protein
MRFCPFCSAENPVDAVSCATCARRLPPPPNRRARTGAGPATGIVPRRMDPSVATAVGLPVGPPPGPVAPAAPAAVVAAPASVAPAPSRLRRLDARRALATALLPPPTALRRTAPPPEPRPAGVQARRKDDAGAAEPPPPSATEATATTAATTATTATTAATTAAIADAAPDATVPVDEAWLVDPKDLTPAPTAALAPPTAPPPTSGPPTPAPPVLPPAATTIAPGAGPSTGRDPTSSREPPPTRILRTDGDDRPFIPPTVMPVPEVPDHGLVNAARYAVAFARARWQRRRAVKLLRAEIDSDTAALDGVLLTLGREARAAGVTNRVLADENAAITAAEQRRDAIAGQGTEVLGRKADENTKFEDIERQRQATVSDAERVVADAQRDVTTYEAQRRSLRDKRKDLERRQKAYLQAAEARESDAERSPMGDARAELRRAAEGHRREAASLDPDRQDLERKLAAVERPLSSAQAKLEAAKAELDAAKRALADAREGHRHRLAELDAEHGRKLREHELAEAEIVRRMVTLGTLINLHRVDRPEFAELYQRVDRLRAAINARTTEIDRLTAERSAYDRPSLIRGCAVLGGVVVGLVAIIAIILAVA